MNNLRVKDDFDYEDIMDEESLMDNMNEHGKTLVHTEFFNSFEDDFEDEFEEDSLKFNVKNDNNNNNNFKKPESK
ncbi:hypothetical protein DDB_G0289957 [Dictyostelium discoideum AX4]|uniref:Uncharacterized protein DDB_G0289957 n=1 Tax=Dictyostelium discoideum TaxID=44689 RepID=Y8669_DICDI|nr:hypothetical protein DDB_G0289957 [Dictyostelium discoideum AX4]Q54GR2.1 RecName: Full=Uncharacterized protein DDB_G0289957 [Dictyostelium discoideum]EAL62491.1 hypothetical protein DDB_G0289957 [Dictyostelium discoideum AX4]|eukprot:XP_636007.1 hypothetical protein DDB_G0289957 [Dictyostelium discoideum AX4]